jgi:hypothetical protein
MGYIYEAVGLSKAAQQLQKRKACLVWVPSPNLHGTPTQIPVQPTSKRSLAQITWSMVDTSSVTQSMAILSPL